MDAEQKTDGKLRLVVEISHQVPGTAVDVDVDDLMERFAGLLGAFVGPVHRVEVKRLQLVEPGAVLLVKRPKRGE